MRSEGPVQTWVRFNVQTSCRPWRGVLGSSADRADLWGAFTGVRGRARVLARTHACAYAQKPPSRSARSALCIQNWAFGSARGLHFGFNHGLHEVFTLWFGGLN